MTRNLLRLGVLAACLYILTHSADPMHILGALAVLSIPLVDRINTEPQED